MTQPRQSLVRGPAKRVPILAVVLLIIAVLTCSAYSNLSLMVKQPEDLVYFPPFVPRYNANSNNHLGAEYFNIAKSLVAGKGFSNPFNDLASGPTAWMPPVMPCILASALWLFNGDRNLVMAAMILAQIAVLIGTGLLVVLLVLRTAPRVKAMTAVAVFFLSVLTDYNQWFQRTHDCWLVLLTLDLLIAGLCFVNPFRSWKTAVSWGSFGGLSALVNPLVAFAWAVLSVVRASRQRALPQLGIAALVSLLTVAPWIARNYCVFRRVIPVKSNLAYELYQSQCLQPSGLLHTSTFVHHHPIHSGSRERMEFEDLGEMAYLDRKWVQFCQAVWADPEGFLKRIGDRFLGALLWYDPLNENDKTIRPYVLWVIRVTHALPFLALLALLGTQFRKGLAPEQWVVIGVYACYLLPYVVVSYYDRYAAPLLGVKVLLMLWTADRLLNFRIATKAVVLPQRPSAPAV